MRLHLAELHNKRKAEKESVKDQKAAQSTDVSMEGA